MITTIIGTGLIGGSIAKDLRNTSFASQLIGVDINSKNAERALSLNLVDDILPLKESIEKSDLIILAIPVDIASTLIIQILDSIPSNAVLTDVGSTKTDICKLTSNHPKRNQFVSGHPIAGTENVGPDAAIKDLFKNKIGIICEKDKSNTKALELIKKMYEHLGMSIKYMEAEDHDKHIAYVSHLSHITSFALGKTVLNIEKNETTIFDLAGSGFSSTARLAMSSPEMWTPIFEQNSTHILNALDEYILEVKKFRDDLYNKNTDKLFQFMNEANDIRRILKKRSS